MSDTRTIPLLCLLYLMIINIYINLSLSLQTTEMFNGERSSPDLSRSAAPQLASRFDITPSVKTPSTQRLKSYRSKLNRGEVSWQTAEQNAMQSYAAQGMK